MASNTASRDEVARQSCRELGKAIVDTYTDLAKLFYKYNDLICKRWTNMSTAKRKKKLLQAWPDMPSPHRPDIQALHSGRKIEQAAALWPHINQHDLSREAEFLLMLQSRSIKPPNVFCMSDYDSLRIGLLAEVITFPKSESYILLTPQTPIAEYGEMSPGPHLEKQSFIYNGVLTVEKGKVLLEVQKRIYVFLVDMCHLILHDQAIDLASLPSSPQEISHQVSDSNANTIDLAPSSSLRLQAAYRLPETLDLPRLEGLIQARYSSAKRQVLDLKEDPGCFLSAVLEASEHLPEMILDEKNQMHSCTKKGNDKKFYEKALIKALGSALSTLESWHHIRNLFATLRVMAEKYSGILANATTLPADFEQQLCLLGYHLTVLKRTIIKEMRIALPSSPGLRPYYRRASKGEPIYGDTIVPRNDLHAEPVRSHLIKRFHPLLDEYTCQLIGESILVDEIDSYLASNKASAKILTASLIESVAQLSISGEISSQLALPQPWTISVMKAILRSAGSLERSYNYTQCHTKRLLRHSSWVGLVDIILPTKGKFDYPVGKPLNKDRVGILRRTEENLAAFWSKFEETMTKQNALSPAVKKTLESACPNRTSEWNDIAAKATLSSGKPTSDPGDLASPFTSLIIGETSEKEKSHRITTGTRSKAKTRGIPFPEAPLNEEKPKAPTTTPKIAVSSRSYAVLETIFSHPTRESPAGEVHWSEFQYMMRELGFGGQSMGGSIWHFTPGPKLQPTLSHGIQFHSPHPRPKIALGVARSFGRHFRSVYSWTFQNFEQA